MSMRLFAVALFSLCGMAASGQVLHSVAKLDSPVAIRSAVTCDQGAQVAGVGDDGALYVWKLPSAAARKITVPDGHVEMVACGGGNTLAAWLGEGKAQVLVLDMGSGEVRKHIHSDGYLWQFALSPDGSLLAIATNTSPTQLWDTHTGEKIAVGVTTMGASNTAGFSPDGNMFVSGDADTVIRGYDRRGKLLFAADGGLLEPFDIAFTGDSKTFAVASAGGTVSLFEAASGKKLKTTISCGNPIFRLKTSPDSKQVMALELNDFSFKPTAIGLWDMRSGEIKKNAVEASNVIGMGADASHLLLIKLEGPKAVTVYAVQ